MDDANFRVFVRCRASGDARYSILNSREILKTDTRKRIQFDRVFGPEATQQEVCETCALPLLSDFVAGKNATVFAYGQTGTGKTYTISGNIGTATAGAPMELDNGDLPPDAGLIPRVLKNVFTRLGSSSDFSLEMTYIEIYNEQLCDLLDLALDAGVPGVGGSAAAATGGNGNGNGHSNGNGNGSGNGSGNASSSKLRIVENRKTHSVELLGATSVPVTSFAAALRVYAQANRRRATAATNSNASSSRSHAVLTLVLVTKEVVSGMAVRSKLHLVDLAGSESVGKSGARHQRAHEAGQINRSLLSLGRVIEQRAAQQRTGQPAFVSFRDSKLTHLLQDALGGPTKTCMIATISLGLLDEDESRSTLEYALRARSIRNPPQTEIEITDMHATLQSLSRRLEDCQRDLRAQRTRDGSVFLTTDDFRRLKSDQRRLSELEARHETTFLQQRLEIDKLRRERAELAAEKRRLADTLARTQSQQVALEQQLHNHTRLQKSVADSRPALANYIRTVDAINAQLGEAFAALPNELRALGNDLQLQIDRARDNSVAKIQSAIATSDSPTGAASVGTGDDDDAAVAAAAAADAGTAVVTALREYRGSVESVWTQQWLPQTELLRTTKHACTKMLDDLEAAVADTERLREADRRRSQLLEELAHRDNANFQLLIKSKQERDALLTELRQIDSSCALRRLTECYQGLAEGTNKLLAEQSSAAATRLPLPDVDAPADVCKGTVHTILENVQRAAAASTAESLRSLLAQFEKDRLVPEQNAITAATETAFSAADRVSALLAAHKRSVKAVVSEGGSLFDDLGSGPQRSPRKVLSPSPSRRVPLQICNTNNLIQRSPIAKQAASLGDLPDLAAPLREQKRNRTVSPLGSPSQIKKTRTR